jgi:site-specific recombinase XerC
MDTLLSNLIKAKGLKPSKIFQEAGISRAYKYQIEHNLRPIPEHLNKILKSYGIGLNVSLEEVEETKSKPKTNKAKLPANVYEVFKEFKRAEPVSNSALNNYDKSIGRFLKTNPVSSSPEDIIKYLNKFPGNKYGYANRHFHWRNLRTFYKFLYMKFDYPNPIITPKGEYLVPEPHVDSESIQPSITKEEVNKLLKSDKLDSRDKALIAIPYFSSMRISEWAEIEVEDIDFKSGMVKEVVVKGRHLTAKTIANVDSQVNFPLL